jgi:transmembrane sensor
MTRDPDDIQVLGEASAWRVKLSELVVESTPAFEAWRAADPAHAQAWTQVSETYGWWGEQGAQPEVMALRAATLERARRRQAMRWRAAPRRRSLSLIAAGLVIAVIGVGAWWANTPQVYRTALGERRTVTLQDGSQLALDADSEVRVRLAAHARRLELIRGQARFNVAHDTARPFTVRAGDAVVVATGTSFNVDRLGRVVTVTLLEGRVTVLRDNARAALPMAVAPPRPAAPVVARLTPGQQLTLQVAAGGVESPGAAPALRPTVVAQADVGKAVAWETGQLVFDDDRLDMVAARIGRYGSRKVTVDPAAANLTLSGVFNSGDLTTFVDVVQRALPVFASQDADGTIRLSHR